MKRIDWGRRFTPQNPLRFKKICQKINQNEKGGSGGVLGPPESIGVFLCGCGYGVTGMGYTKGFWAEAVI